jgi:hypothetical protein
MPTIWFIGYLITLFQTQELIPEKRWRYDHKWKVETIFKVSQKAEPIYSPSYNGWTCVSSASTLSRLIRVFLQKRLTLTYTQ